jgi:hypothetical protein
VEPELPHTLSGKVSVERGKRRWRSVRFFGVLEEQPKGGEAHVRRGVVAAADGGMAATGARCCDGSRVAADRVRNGREFGEGSTRFFILLLQQK